MESIKSLIVLNPPIIITTTQFKFEILLNIAYSLYSCKHLFCTLLLDKSRKYINYNNVVNYVCYCCV